MLCSSMSSSVFCKADTLKVVYVDAESVLTPMMDLPSVWYWSVVFFVDKSVKVLDLTIDPYLVVSTFSLSSSVFPEGRWSTAFAAFSG
jgi:hypothetical protein